MHSVYLPKDARGRRVPPALVAPFIARDSVNRFVNQIAEIEGQIEKMAERGDLHNTDPLDHLRELFRQTIAELVAIVPAIVCDNCHRPGAVQQACKTCDGKGWLSPKEIRRALSRSQLLAAALLEQSRKEGRYLLSTDVPSAVSC